LAITVVGDAKGGACKREEKKSGDTTPPFLLLQIIGSLLLVFQWKLHCQNIK
jgi:hypothetical protein